MVLVKFNNNYRDKELKREIKANEPVEMTLARADEVVKNITEQAEKFPGHKNFKYDRVDKEEDVKKVKDDKKEEK